jgi:Kdo2-lipid IVA lauroyltransferase/acyltransferase
MTTPPTVTLAHRFQDGLIRALEGILGALPESLSTAFGGGLGWFVGTVLRIRRGVVEANLRQAFPEATPDWIRRTASASFAHLGRESVALVRFGSMGREALLAQTEVEGMEVMESALAKGRGVILLTGHMGNWEIGGAALAVRGVPVDAVVRSQNNPLFDARIVETREALGVRLIKREVSTRLVLESLRKGRMVGLAADQNVLQGGVFVPFFGKLASTTRGPALLAERTGAEMVFATALRLPGRPARWKVEIRPLIPDGPPSGRVPETVLVPFLAALEDAIRNHPEQYLWAHKRWKTRPPGEEPADSASVPNPHANTPESGEDA